MPGWAGCVEGHPYEQCRAGGRGIAMLLDTAQGLRGFPHVEHVGLGASHQRDQDAGD
jgi:hypothetical protein